MDKELIFYLIFGLIYLLSRLGKKKRKKGQAAPPAQQSQPQQQPRPVTQQPQSSNPGTNQQEEETPMSFEDILRQLSGEGRKKSTPASEPVAQQPAEPPVRKPKPLVSEPVPQPTEPVPSPVYETSPQTTEASDLWSAYKRKDKEKKSPHKAIEQVEDKPMEGIIKFEGYEEKSDENPLAEEIREMLKDKEDVRKAVVLSEILQRRY